MAGRSSCMADRLVELVFQTYWKWDICLGPTRAGRLYPPPSLGEAGSMTGSSVREGSVRPSRKGLKSNAKKMSVRFRAGGWGGLGVVCKN